MPQIHVISRAGLATTIQAETGLSVMEALRDNGFDDIQAICGGCCACATCHIYVDDAFLPNLPQPSRDERELLETSTQLQSNSRLSCQIPVTAALDGLRVTIAPED